MNMSREIDVRFCIQLILKRKKPVLAVTILFALLAFVVFLLLPADYESSLILEVGEIYLGKMSNQEKKLLEEPETVAAFISSDGILDRAREELALDLYLKSIRKNLAVETFREESALLPVLRISYRGHPPRMPKNIVSFLAGLVEERHDRIYEPYRKSLDELIETTGRKISALEKIIAAQLQYQKLAQAYIERGEGSVEEFTRDLEELDSSAPSALDLLFLQSSSLTEKQHITELTQFKSDLELRIARNRKEITEAEMEAINLRNMKELSSPTEIISPAVIPDRPVGPGPVVMILLGAVLGFALSSLAILFGEYLKD